MGPPAARQGEDNKEVSDSQRGREGGPEGPGCGVELGLQVRGRPGQSERGWMRAERERRKKPSHRQAQLSQVLGLRDR